MSDEDIIVCSDFLDEGGDLDQMKEAGHVVDQHVKRLKEELDMCEEEYQKRKRICLV